MNKRAGRFVLWTMALAFAVLVLRYGRPFAPAGKTAEFLPGSRSDKGTVTIRLEGDGVTSGVYHFNHTVDTGTVIKMTVPFFCDDSWDFPLGTSAVSG